MADPNLTDSNRTKDELLNELENLRQRVEQLEGELDLSTGRSHRTQAREQLENAKIQFISQFEIVDAKGVDLSQGGICFDVAEPLYFHMRVDGPEGRLDSQARLAWIRDTTGGGCRMGFQFVERTPGIRG